MKIIEGTPEEIREYESKEHGNLEEVLNPEPEGSAIVALEYPKKVTFKWLTEHVPIGLWLSLLGLLFALYVAGIQSTKITLVQEIFDVCACSVESGGGEPPEKKGSESGKR